MSDLLLDRGAWRDPRAYDRWYAEAVREAAALVEQRAARTTLAFGDWLRQESPSWPWHYRHLAVIRRALARVTRGACNRLMIFVHPRSYKSEMVTVRYPAYLLDRDPSTRIIVGSYNATLAATFSRKTRDIATARGVPMNPERNSVDDWWTAAGGGLRSVGVGGGVTGFGASICLLDDPIKNWEEARSRAYRDQVWNWYTSSIYTRLEPDGGIILIQTRWAEDDLAGRILASPGGADWEVVRIPALAETQADRDAYARKIGRPAGEPDPLDRGPGEAMNPERFDAAALARMRREMGASVFAALYQNRPSAAAGDLFRREWFEIVETLPEMPALVRYWDKAGSLGRHSAHTAGVLMGRGADGVFYVLDLILGRWRAPDREAVIKQAAAADFATWGSRVETVIEQEPGSGGLESAEHTIANLAGYRVAADRPRGDKAVRAEPLAAQAGIGRVKLRRGAWNGDYLDSLVAFPNGDLVDPVDASSGAFARLSRPSAAVASGRPRVVRAEEMF